MDNNTSERKAFLLMQEGKFEEASNLFKTIVDNCPEFEHGAGWFNLGTCYEELNKLTDAEACYRKALHYHSNNTHYLGNLASLLYLHGSPLAALGAYFDLFVAENYDPSVVKECMPSLRTLCSKMESQMNN